jgi:HPt (histidine-containing phosphotransfer) domain-containing protein
MEEIIIDNDIINELREIGDDEFLGELINTFISQSDDIIDQIEKSYFENNNTLLSQLSHKLKGSSLNIGAIKLGAISKYLELNTKNGFPDDTFTKIHELKETYKLTKEKLNSIIKK